MDKTRRQIFKGFRKAESSENNKWPLCGKFNGANRVIRRLWKWERDSGYYLEGLELELWLDGEMSHLVNSIIY